MHADSTPRARGTQTWSTGRASTSGRWSPLPSLRQGWWQARAGGAMRGPFRSRAGSRSSSWAGSSAEQPRTPRAASGRRSSTSRSSSRTPSRCVDRRALAPAAGAAHRAALVLGAQRVAAGRADARPRTRSRTSCTSRSSRRTPARSPPPACSSSARLSPRPAPWARLRRDRAFAVLAAVGLARDRRQLHVPAPQAGSTARSSTRSARGRVHRRRGERSPRRVLLVLAALARQLRPRSPSGEPGRYRRSRVPAG